MFKVSSAHLASLTHISTLANVFSQEMLQPVSRVQTFFITVLEEWRTSAVPKLQTSGSLEATFLALPLITIKYFFYTFYVFFVRIVK